MEQLEQIPIGQEANDKTGDPLRNGMAKVNANFTKVQAGVDAVELTAANAAQTATEAKTTADAAIPAAQKGMAGGVAPLDATGKVPAAHLEDYLLVEERGAAGGVAPLGEDGKVPAINLPAPQDSIPLSQKGQPGGVATLGSDGKVPPSQLAVDAAQLASDLAALRADYQANVAFTMLYPGGGNAASPGNVTINSRYVMSNPWPGLPVLAVAEILMGTVWTPTGWRFLASDNSQGVSVGQYGDSVVLQTGIAALWNRGDWQGSPIPASNPGISLTSLPCRVKVWKVKGG